MYCCFYHSEKLVIIMINGQGDKVRYCFSMKKLPITVAFSLLDTPILCYLNGCLAHGETVAADLFSQSDNLKG